MSSEYHYRLTTGGAVIRARNAEDTSLWSSKRVVVIDPEDGEQVERLYDLLAKDAMTDPGALVSTVASFPRTRVQAALREFAEPKPPKPDEPTRLGAVVEDSVGLLYVRCDLGRLAPWRASAPPNAERPYRYYSDLNIVRVLSEGVPA